MIREKEIEEFYGKTFALHDAAGMEIILEPSRQRFGSVFESVGTEVIRSEATNQARDITSGLES